MFDIENIKHKTERLFQKYSTAAETYEHFLKGHRSQESATEDELVRNVLESVRKSVSVFIDYLNSFCSNINSKTSLKYASHKNKSQRTFRTHTSRGSSKLTEALLEHTVNVEEALCRRRG